MALLDSLRAAFKGGAGRRVPLARHFTSPWAPYPQWAFEPAGTRLPFEYRSAVTCAYVDNPVAQRAVRLVSEGIGSAPLAPTDKAALALVAATSAGQSLLETLAAQLLHPAVEGTANAPPAAPDEGECWLVGDEPTGAWTDHPGTLASYQAGDWIFAEAREGMHVLDRVTGQTIRYRDGWQRPETPAAPTGGTTVDTEARAAIAELIEVLIASGILAQS